MNLHGDLLMTTMNKPVFCTEESSFMASGGDAVRSQFFRLKKQPKLKHRINSIYFHRRLEEKLGYDIVNFVDGHIPYLKDGDKIKCTTITPKGEEIESILITYRKDPNTVYCYIVLSEDVDISFKS
jgi:hypothetical protein